jgi:hypothetical protein
MKGNDMIAILAFLILAGTYVTASAIWLWRSPGDDE